MSQCPRPSQGIPTATSRIARPTSSIPTASQSAGIPAPSSSRESQLELFRKRQQFGRLPRAQPAKPATPPSAPAPQPQPAPCEPGPSGVRALHAPKVRIGGNEQTWDTGLRSSAQKYIPHQTDQSALSLELFKKRQQFGRLPPKPPSTPQVFYGPQPRPSDYVSPPPAVAPARSLHAPKIRAPCPTTNWGTGLREDAHKYIAPQSAEAAKSLELFKKRQQFGRLKAPSVVRPPSTPPVVYGPQPRPSDYVSPPPAVAPTRSLHTPRVRADACPTASWGTGLREDAYKYVAPQSAETAKSLDLFKKRQQFGRLKAPSGLKPPSAPQVVYGPQTRPSGYVSPPESPPCPAAIPRPASIGAPMRRALHMPKRYQEVEPAAQWGSGLRDFKYQPEMTAARRQSLDSFKKRQQFGRIPRTTPSAGEPLIEELYTPQAVPAELPVKVMTAISTELKDVAVKKMPKSGLCPPSRSAIPPSEASTSSTDVKQQLQRKLHTTLQNVLTEHGVTGPSKLRLPSLATCPTPQETCSPARRPLHALPAHKMGKPEPKSEWGTGLRSGLHTGPQKCMVAPAGASRSGLQAPGSMCPSSSLPKPRRMSAIPPPGSLRAAQPSSLPRAAGSSKLPPGPCR